MAPRTEATGVFLVRLRAVFRSGIPAGPDKFLAIREFHVVHECVFFPMCPGSQINLLRVRKTLCASVATSEEELLTIRKLHVVAEVNLLPKGLGSWTKLQRFWPQLSSFLVRFRPVKYGIEALDILSYIGQGVVSSIPVFGLVNGPVKPWSNLVNLGQTWSNLVKALQTLGNVSRTAFQGFLGRNVGQRINDSIFARSDFLGFRVLLRLSRSSSRFACPVLPGPNGHSKGWRRSVGMRKDDSGLEMVKRLARSFGNSRMTIMRARDDGRARPHYLKGAARPFASHFVAFLSLFRSLDPTSPLSALLLISCYPGLRLTRRLRLRAPRDSDRRSVFAYTSYRPGLEIHPERSGTNWDLTLSRIAIGPGLGILSKRSGTNWDLTLSRIAIGPGLGILSKRSGTNWDLTLSRIAIIRPGLGILSKRSGTNWDLTLSRIATGPGLGILSKRSGTNWDLTFSRIAIGCLIEVVGVGAIAGPIALRKANL
uniref:Uncharacterized protein n=1 Tax=Fagus sylvatica TaxID=28930 RepID=A0A2N9H8M3_FAGSY